MNILDKLPFLKPDASEQEVAEHDEAQARIDRIAFHRDHVRNGPSNFKQPTNGQAKRAKKRALARDTKKARRQAIRKYRREQQEGATIRGHLQGAGVLPRFDNQGPTPAQAVQSITWLVSRFAPADDNGQVRLTRDVVANALQTGLNRWQKIVGLTPTPLSPAYRLPVALSDGSTVDEV